MKLIRNLIFRLMFVLPIFVFTATVAAQSDPTGESPVTRTYAITNATIVQAPGKMMEKATIVISEGLITEIGTDISVPKYADVIDGAGMFVYAGFIDGMSYTGADRPDAMERPSNLFTPDPPNDFAGITPEKHVIEQVKVDENSIESMRKAGFAISHTVPYGRMLPGSGALILLKNATHPDELALKNNASMYSQFVGAPGAYPGNTLGIMAKFRNLYTNAEYARNHAQAYEKDPAGMARPARDRVLEAFYPVVANEKPIFYNASSVLNARRALRLQKELGFNLVLGNLQEGWELADEIKSTNTKVFMSLELPKEPKDSKEKEKSDEIKQLEQRRAEAYKKYLTQYSELKKAGIQFGFSTIDIRGNDVKKNLQLLVENGLSEDDALAALTTNAASILGISNITGTLEKGKLGNLIVTNGSYFDKKSQLKFSFIDGEKYEFEIKDTAKKDNGEANSGAYSDVVGTWTYSFTTPQGEQRGNMIIKVQDGMLEGVLTSDDGSPDNDMLNLSYVNKELSYDFDVDAGGQSINIVVVGTVTGDEYVADASIAAFNMSFPILATKEAPEQ